MRFRWCWQKYSHGFFVDVQGRCNDWFCHNQFPCEPICTIETIHNCGKNCCCCRIMKWQHWNQVEMTKKTLFSFQDTLKMKGISLNRTVIAQLVTHEWKWTAYGGSKWTVPKAKHLVLNKWPVSWSPNGQLGLRLFTFGRVVHSRATSTFTFTPYRPLKPDGNEGL